MRKAILAALVALTAGTGAIAPAAAASLTITTDNGRVYDNDRYDNDFYDNGVRRGWDRQHRWRHGMTYRRAYRECEVTTTKHWRHGRLIVERTRECY
jgi:hypothetical protein